MMGKACRQCCAAHVARVKLPGVVLMTMIVNKGLFLHPCTTELPVVPSAAKTTTTCPLPSKEVLSAVVIALSMTMTVVTTTTKAKGMSRNLRNRASIQAMTTGTMIVGLLRHINAVAVQVQLHFKDMHM